MAGQTAFGAYGLSGRRLGAVVGETAKLNSCASARQWSRMKKNLGYGDRPMAEATLSIVDRLEAKVDRIPWFILVTWITIILAQVGIYFQILQIISKLR